MASRRRVEGSAVLAHQPTSVPTDSIAFNPRNPRDDYGDVGELAASIKEVGVLQPIGVVRYEVFLTHYPEHEHEIGAHDWVVLHGNRRLAAARLVDLAEIPIRVMDALGRGDQLDESVLIENIHRQALPPLREAAALRILCDRHGSQTAVAGRIGKSNGYVSQRLSLLNLTPDLQAALKAADLLVEEARKIAKFPPEQQADELAKLRAAVYAVKTDNTPAADEPAEESAADDVAEPPAPRERVVRHLFQVGSPPDMAKQLREYLSVDERRDLARLLLADDEAGA